MAMKHIKGYSQALLESLSQDELNSRLLDASDKEKLEEVRLLLDMGAQVDAEDDTKKTPLHWAAWNGHIEIARLLIKRGAQVDAEDKYKQTPLHMAAYNGHTGVARLLIERGAQVDAVNADKQTPLHWAAKNGHTGVARLLIERGAQVDAEDVDKWTPLHIARWTNAHKMFSKLVILRGADPFKAFDGPDEIIEFFKGDISWMPEELKSKMKKRSRSRGAFGRF